ncbi:MAG: alpha-2-macroglobulin family protein [Acidobacteriota bacterium]
MYLLARLPLLLLLTLVGASACTAQPPKTPEDLMAYDAAWKEIDRLIDESKMQAAADRVGVLLEEAKEAGAEITWTHALVRRIQLETALGGFETAVRTLRTEPWPEDPRGQAVLELLYGQTLLHYLRSYSWEIGNRERTIGSEEPEIDRWTRDQIRGEILAAYGRAWAQRDAWGAEPLGRSAAFFESGDYPPHIRGTFRDTVSYVSADILADSLLWSAAQENGVWRLDIADLLDRDFTAELTDPDVHPLAQLAAILADLERWHASGNRPEAAFEARLERLRKLRYHFDNQDDRAVQLATLRRGLDTLGRTAPWWSMGKALEAELLELEQRPEARIDAHAAALEGARSHPGTPGSETCRALVARFEAPSYNLESMQSDALGRRSLRIEHSNLERLFLRAYRVDIDRQVAASSQMLLLPRHNELAQLITERGADASWSVDLPNPGDFRPHRTYSTPPFDTPGLYLVVSSVRQDFSTNTNQLQATWLSVGDLVLIGRDAGDAFELTARSGDGAPLAGVDVTLWQRQRNSWRQAQSATTDDTGEARFAHASNDANYRRVTALARLGDQVAFTDLAGGQRQRNTRQQTRTLVFTDRAIYRPGQTVQWKIITFAGSEGDWKVSPGKTVAIMLRDGNGEQVATATVETNRFGSAAGTFEVPASGRLLGWWSIDTNAVGATQIQVEEYKRPTFEVTFETPEDPQRLNRDVTLTGEARYYFGLPVNEGTVRWRVERQPLWLPVRGAWWSPPSFGRSELVAAGETTPNNGSFDVSFLPTADEALAEQGAVRFRYQVTAEVTDGSGETREASTSLVLGFVTVMASIESSAGYVEAGEPVTMTVNRTTLNGAPTTGEGTWRITRLRTPATPPLPAEVPLPEPPSGWERFQTPGDTERPRWEQLDLSSLFASYEDGDTVATGTIEHDGTMAAELNLDALQGGLYRVHYTTTDRFGGEVKADTTLIVAGETALALPLVLRAPQNEIAVGDTLRVLVASGFDDQPIVLERFRAGKRVGRRQLAGGTPRIVEIPVDERDRGGFTLRVATVRDHQLLTDRIDVEVPWVDRQLDIQLATFRDRLRPGDEETWSLTVRDATGGILDAEILAAMYDRSLDLFERLTPPDPLTVYPRRAGAPALVTNLGSAYRIWNGGRGFGMVPSPPVLTGARLTFFDAYGIGGPGRRGGGIAVQAMRAAPMAMESAPMVDSVETADAALEKVAVAADSPNAAAPPSGPPDDEPPPTGTPSLRENFAETAFFFPQLTLDADGAATFSFTVPDAVTSWRLWGVAHTTDLRAGALEATTRTVKDLLIRPYLPRFLRQDDRAVLAIQVDNSGETTLRGTVDLTLRDPDTEEDLSALFGLTPERASDLAFVVEAGKSTTLEVPVTAPRRLGPVAVEAVARAGALSDGERRPLPILPSRVALAESRFAALSGDTTTRTLHFESLTAADPTRIDEQMVITIDANLLASVLRAVPALVDDPDETAFRAAHRLYAAGLLTALYERHPALARLGAQMADRETRYASFDQPDPNRRMLFEETPWLTTARGGKTGDDDAGDDELLQLLDPAIAELVRDRAATTLRELQNNDGGLPWKAGGPSSVFVTAYVLQELARVLDHGVAIDELREVAASGWRYLDRECFAPLRDEDERRQPSADTLAFIAYVLWSYPDTSWTGNVISDDDKRLILDRAFDRWRQVAPRIKAYLALTLRRAERLDDARLVLDSVLDSARQDDDLGVYWQPEDRAWMWYHDTTESHALVLRALLDVRPDDPRRHGLVQWLFLDKQLNHWRSPRATAEVLEALAAYLDREDQLGQDDRVTVTTGDETTSFVFAADEPTTRNQIVERDERLDADLATITVEKATSGLVFATATWHFSTEQLPASASASDLFTVERRYYRRLLDGDAYVLEPLETGTALTPGDQLEVEITLRAGHAADFVALRDPRPAGFEPETLRSGYRWAGGVGVYEEIRDSGANYFFEQLPAGEYVFRHRLRASHGGTFRAGPAVVQSVYAPQFAAYSTGERVTVTGSTASSSEESSAP